MKNGTYISSDIFNSASLPLNNYYAYLQINSNDTANPADTVLAMLHVQDLTIFLEQERDSICFGCSTKLNVMFFGCTEESIFDWSFAPPGFISTEKSPVVSPTVNTTYTVTVTDGNYYSQKSVLIKVYGASDIRIFDIDGREVYNRSFDLAQGFHELYFDRVTAAPGM